MKTISYDPDLWQLVPVVPSEDMREVLADLIKNTISYSRLWRCVLAAAPSAPEQPQQPGYWHDGHGIIDAPEPKQELPSWRVGEFYSSPNPTKKVLCLAVGGDDIERYEKHGSFIRWVAGSSENKMHGLEGWVADPDAIPDEVIEATRSAICREFGSAGTAGYYKRILARIFAALLAHHQEPK